jgi:hypothetical protein
MSNIKDDATFQTSWVSKKRSPETEGTLKKPPSLRKVLWNLKWSEGFAASIADADFENSDLEEVEGINIDNFSVVDTDVVCPPNMTFYIISER